MNCTICDSNNVKVKYLKNKYNILHCLDCNHLFTECILTPERVDQIYSDDYFFSGGAGYDDYTLERDMLIKRGEYYADKISKYMAPGKVLDIGSAAGFLLKGFENKGWQGTGIEPNNFMVEYGKKSIGINIIKGTIETIRLEEKFDLIILIQVVAHLYDLKTSINRISAFLNRGGHLLIETWNKDSFTARIFGKNWHEFSPPSTLNYFSEKTLIKLISQHGFLLHDQGQPKKSIHTKHAKSLIKYKLLESERLKWLAGITSLIPGDMIIPCPSEDLFWALFKKS